MNQAGVRVSGSTSRAQFRLGVGLVFELLNLTFVSESFVQELNGTPRDTKGSSFVLNPSVLTLKGYVHLLKLSLSKELFGIASGILLDHL